MKWPGVAHAKDHTKKNKHRVMFTRKAAQREGKTLRRQAGAGSSHEAAPPFGTGVHVPSVLLFALKQPSPYIADLQPSAI